MLKRVISIALFFFSTLSFAAPSQIIIIRHGDKLVQEDPGTVLSAKGEIRAINFAMYYLKKFGEPDYIIASNAGKDTSSLREIQTVAPLANILQAKHPNDTVPISHVYSSSNYPKLVKEIMSNKMYNGKNVLICWSHGKIPGMATKFGVTEKLEKWPSNDFDSVYVLKYSNNGHLKDFEILHQQYPVEFSGNWSDLHTMLTRG